MENKGMRHVLVVPFSAQGHINPMLQFSKRLSSKGIKTTLAVTLFIYKSMSPEPSASVQIDTISDGCDQGGVAEANGSEDYIKRLETVGSKTLAELIVKHKQSSNPVDCVVCDTVMPWCLDVARQFVLEL